jgi:hypothetical protein
MVERGRRVEGELGGAQAEAEAEGEARRRVAAALLLFRWLEGSGQGTVKRASKSSKRSCEWIEWLRTAAELGEQRGEPQPLQSAALSWRP